MGATAAAYRFDQELRLRDPINTNLPAPGRRHTVLRPLSCLHSAVF